MQAWVVGKLDDLPANDAMQIRWDVHGRSTISVNRQRLVGRIAPVSMVNSTSKTTLANTAAVVRRDDCKVRREGVRSMFSAVGRYASHGRNGPRNGPDPDFAIVLVIRIARHSAQWFFADAEGTTSLLLMFFGGGRSQMPNRVPRQQGIEG